MPTVQSINVPEELLHRILAADRPLELYELVYLSSVRPDPRNVSDIRIVMVTVRAWARGVEHMQQILKAHPQSIHDGPLQHELTPLVMISCAPMGGLSIESIIDTSEDAADSRAAMPPPSRFPSREN